MKKKEIIEHELIPLLRSFTAEELQKFPLFLKSPYFKTRSSLFVFYNELIKFHPLYNHVKLTKEMLYKKVYKGKAYKDSSFRDLFNLAVRAAKDFLAYESFASDSMYCIHILKQLRLRNQHSLFSSQLKKSVSQLEHYGGIDPSFFLLRFNLDAERFNENTVIHKITSPKKALLHAQEITAGSTNIIIYSVLEIISNYIAIIIESDRSRVVKMDKFMTEAVKSLDLKRMYEKIRGKSMYDYVLEIYYLLLNAFINRGSWEEYIKYKSAVLKNIDKIGFNEAADLHAQMIKISILGAKTGNSRTEFDNELLGLYDNFLRKKYFRTGKSLYLPPDLFRAIAVQGLKMNSIELLGMLIKNSGPWLNPETKENLINYAKAYYYFLTQDHNTVLNTINKINIEYFVFKYDIYILKLKVYYELGEPEPALDLINAFRVFISNDKLMNDESRKRYSQFAYFTEKMIRISLNDSAIDLDTLTVKINKEKNAVSRDWIIEKLAEFSPGEQTYKRSI